MTHLKDTPDRYGFVSRVLHWGMAILFLAQFLSAALHWALPRENTVRDLFWSYHSDLGLMLFGLVLIRGVWGMVNLHRRPAHHGPMGRAAQIGHGVLYALMVIVPGLRVMSSIGGRRGLSFLGVEITPGQVSEIAWMTAPSDWHGELGWVLLLVVIGHVVMAVGYHQIIRRDGTMARMAR